MHAICDSQGRPLNLFVTAGSPLGSMPCMRLPGNGISDDIGARAMLSSLPNVDWLPGDRGYGADWLREALQNKGMRPCILGRKHRNKTVKYDKRRCKRPSRDIAAQYPAGQ